jgi:hypothetical protein
MIQGLRLPSLLLFAALAASPAAAYMAQNDFTVRQLDDTRFEVQPRGGLGSSEAWCAAGDFVIRALGLPGNTPIWRITEIPRRSGESMVFSLTSEGANSSTGLASLGGGASVTAAHAEALCWGLKDLRNVD